MTPQITWLHVYTLVPLCSVKIDFVPFNQEFAVSKFTLPVFRYTFAGLRMDSRVYFASQLGSESRALYDLHSPFSTSLPQESQCVSKIVQNVFKN